MYALYLKRPLDFCCALAAILCLSPLLILLTVVGAFKMRGNPFFTQPRPGKDEKIFKLIKFLRSTSLDFFLLGGPALPRRHALFCGVPLRLAARAPLTKPSLALSVGTSFRPTSRNLDSVPRVSALACNDRCRETLEEAA